MFRVTWFDGGKLRHKDVSVLDIGGLVANWQYVMPSNVYLWSVIKIERISESV